MQFKEVPVMPPVLIKFTHDVSEYTRWLAMFGAKADIADISNSQAQESCAVSDEGEVVFLVWMTPCLDYDAADDAGLLTHEAVHIADDYFEHQIDEDQPSAEVRAYVTQYVAKYLIKKHFKWKKKRLKRCEKLAT